MSYNKKNQKKAGDITSFKNKPVDIKTIEPSNNKTSYGLLKYHPEINKLLYCYPNSNQVYYWNPEGDKNTLLNTHGSKIVTAIDIGVKHKCASASEDNTINIFSTSVSDKADIQVINVPSTPTCIQFNTTQSYLAVGFLNNIRIISTVMNQTNTNTIKDAHKGEVIALSYSRPEGDYLASVGEDSKLKIWNTERFNEDNGGTPIHTISLDCSKDVLKKIGISWRPSNSSSILELAIPTYQSNTIKSFQFDVNDMSNKRIKSYTFDDSDGHTKEVTNVQWSVGGEYLASIGLDNNLLIWDCQLHDSEGNTITKEPIARHKHHCQIISISWSLSSVNSISFYDIKGALYTFSNFAEGGEEIMPSVEEFELDPDFLDDPLEATNSKRLKRGINENEDEEEYMDTDNNSRREEGGGGNDDDMSNYSGDSNNGNRGINEDFSQESFSIGSTYHNVNNQAKTRNSKTKRFYMTYNMLGFITKREESKESSSEISSIEIDFHEKIGSHKKVVFSDKDQSFRLASLGLSGAIFASKYTQQELEDYQEKQKNLHLDQLHQQQLRTSAISSNKEDEAAAEAAILKMVYKPISTLFFKSFDSTDGSLDWRYIDKDGIAGVAITKNYVVSCSENRILRIFSLGGIQLNLLSLPGDLVTMNSYGDNNDTLAIVYNKSSSSNGNQCQNVWWLNLATGKQMYHDSLPLSPFSTLSWIGFSNDGLLSTMDSNGMIRQLSNGWMIPSTNDTNPSFLQWIPITDLSKCEKPHSQELYTYWIIGLDKKDIFSLFCCNYPQVKQQTHNRVKIELPLLYNPTSSATLLVNEREFLRNKFQVASYLNRTTRLSSSSVQAPIEESEITKNLAELDAAIIRVFSAYAEQRQYQKCYDLCQMLHLKKSLTIVFQISNKITLPWLSKKIVDLIENFKPINFNPSKNTNAINNTTTTTTATPLSSTPIQSTQIESTPPKVVNKQPKTFDSDLYSSDDVDQSPPPKKSTLSKTTAANKFSNPFSASKSPDNSSKKRKDSPATSTVPSKILKFKQ